MHRCRENALVNATLWPARNGQVGLRGHLADKSGRELLVKSASDLLGCFVGETEKAMAAAFAEAEEAEAVLLIDEADSFLSDRSGARHQWEVSMINEMLRQMESNRARFIATTNRMDILDPATARRFSLAVEFFPMESTQARAMFWSTFDQTPPTTLDRIADLTPGDFAQARKRADLLGEQNPETLVQWLESAATERGSRLRVGF
jgi:SpoVK/Ycf46/Vps4 family AAA+-type ATPase